MHPDCTPKESARFWSKVDKSGKCWIWIARRNKSGYGEFYWRRRTTLAHRLSFEFATGQHPGTLEVMHTCDNPSCVNPAHLVLGTHTDNMRDARIKGRSAIGERNGQSKINQAIADEIRARYSAGGVTKTALSQEYGISHRQTRNILNNIYWVG